MITAELLRAKGTVEALMAISDTDSRSVGQLANEMDLSEGTARERLGDIGDAGLIREEAEIVDDRPQRVYQPTEEGEALAEELRSILSEYDE
jgi:predicted ArsR family transcriptional regulator